MLAASLGAALSFMIAAFVNAFEGESPAPWIAGMFAAFFCFSFAYWYDD